MANDKIGEEIRPGKMMNLTKRPPLDIIASQLISIGVHLGSIAENIKYFPDVHKSEQEE